jgi:hypothetical protein
MANSKHGIPVDKTLNISIWALFWFRADPVATATYKLRVKSQRWVWMKRRMNIELRLIAHIVPFPVLRHQKQRIIDLLSITSIWSTTTFTIYHSSVVHSEQGKSYFKTKDGIVSTMAYRRAANTHAFTWYKTAINTVFPPRYLRLTKRQTDVKT